MDNGRIGRVNMQQAKWAIERNPDAREGKLH